MLFVPSPYYYSTRTGIQTLVPLKGYHLIHVTLSMHCRKIATSGFEDTTLLLLRCNRSFVPIPLRIIGRFILQLAHSRPSFDKQSALLDLRSLLARVMRHLVAHHWSPSIEFLGIGGIHSCVFGSFSGSVEGKHHFLGLLYVFSVVLARFMQGNMFGNVTRPSFLCMAQLLLVLLQLQLEAKVGTHTRPDPSYKLKCIHELRVVLLHIVGNHQSRRLHHHKLTLEMPAPQCTKTEPRLRSD